MAIEGLVGNTPLLRLARWEKYHGIESRLYAKWEGVNPTGSIKDRAALALIRDGEAKGLLAPKGEIVEATSGNMGISLAALGGALGYKVSIVMPEGMSEERTRRIRAYGARLIYSPAKEGMAGAMALAEGLADGKGGVYWPNQFENPVSVIIHEKTTAKEFFVQHPQIDVFAAGIGTACTLIGVGRGLQKQGIKAKIVGIEPAKSPVISGGRSDFHGIEGIGANFVPPLFDSGVVDAIELVTYEESVAVMRDFAHVEGLLIGISAGANLAVLTKLAKEGPKLYTNLATVFPDGGERYFSKKIF